VRRCLKGKFLVRSGSVGFGSGCAKYALRGGYTEIFETDMFNGEQEELNQGRMDCDWGRGLLYRPAAARLVFRGRLRR